MRLLERPVTDDAIKMAKEDEYSDQDIKAGYVESASDSATVLPDTRIIERIDVLDMFDNDFEASRQAELDGFCKFINDMPDVEKGLYVDTPENRAAVAKSLEENPGYTLSSMAVEHRGIFHGLILCYRELERSHPEMFEPGQVFEPYRGYADELTKLIPDYDD